jgi:hypothetical protein
MHFLARASVGLGAFSVGFVTFGDALARSIFARMTMSTAATSTCSDHIPK